MLQYVTALEASLYCIVYSREDTGQIQLTCLHEHLDQTEILPERPCGFRKDRIPIDMILTARNFQQKYQKQNMDLQHDLCRQFQSFDPVSRDGLWKIITTFGCPARFIAIVRQFIDAYLHDSSPIESTLNCFL